jgi:hypothetical protein
LLLRGTGEDRWDVRQWWDISGKDSRNAHACVYCTVRTVCVCGVDGRAKIK